MQSTSLNYADVEKRLFEACPPIIPIYENEFSYWGDWDKDRPGNYLVFATVVVPYLITQLDDPRDEQSITRLFALFEEMAASTDPEVVNLVKLEVVLKLARDSAHLAKARKHMGPRLQHLLRALR